MMFFSKKKVCTNADFVSFKLRLYWDLPAFFLLCPSRNIRNNMLNRFTYWVLATGKAVDFFDSLNKKD